MSIRTWICLSLLVGTFISTRGLAQADSGSGAETSANSILLIQETRAEVSGFDDLKRALDAYLGASAIEVRPYQVKSLPAGQSKQERKVRELAEAESAGAVMWLDIKRRNMSLIFRDNRGEEHTLNRYFDCISPSLTGCADPIASAVSSAISSWIGRAAQPPPEAAPPIKDNELDPVALNRTDWVRPILLPSLLFDVGYTCSFLGEQMLAQGAHVGARMIFMKNLSLEALLEMFSTLRYEDREQGIEAGIIRWPIRILAGGVFEWKSWSFSLSIGLVLSLGIGTKIDMEHTISDKQGTSAGFTTALAIDYRVWKWFGVWLKGGVDVLGTDLKYEIEDANQDYSGSVTLRMAQPTLSIGLSIPWDLGKP